MNTTNPDRFASKPSPWPSDPATPRIKPDTQEAKDGLTEDYARLKEK